MNIRLEDEREKNKKLKMMYIIIIAVCIVAVVATGIIQIVKNLPDKEPEIDTSILQRYKEDFDNIFKNQVNYLKNSIYLKSLMATDFHLLQIKCLQYL